MAYELATDYSKNFDASQAPNFIDMCAFRFGFRNSVPVARRRRYVDLGCAHGSSILALAALYPGLDFVGVDFNSRHIKGAQEEAQRLGVANIEFICADFRDPCLLALGTVDFVAVKGIYNWLPPDAKDALDRLIAALSGPETIVQVHHLVHPGGDTRQMIIKMMRHALGPAVAPKDGRQWLRSFQSQASLFQHHFPQSKATIEQMLSSDDANWHHDILSDDLQLEDSGAMHRRFRSHGLKFLCSSILSHNFLPFWVSSDHADHIRRLPSDQGQTLFDYLSCNGGRVDLFVSTQVTLATERRYDPNQRFGLIVPPSKAALPHQLPNGKLLFEHQIAKALMAHLTQKPCAYAELCQLMPSVTADQMTFWLDALLSAHRIGPFVPMEAMDAVSASTLATMNQTRLRLCNPSLAVTNTTPLLAQAYGNCLVAGWFESHLLLHHGQYDSDAFLKHLLQRMAAANLHLKGPDGQPSRQPLALLRTTIQQFEVDYLSMTDYWALHH